MISFMIEDFSKEVLEKSKKFSEQNIELVNEVKNHYWAFKWIFDLVPDSLETFFSGHHLPFFESEFELDSSLYLAKNGLYRHAFSGLRTILEISLLYIYYDIDDNGFNDIQKWLHSKEDTPSFTRKILGNIFKNKPFSLDEFSYLETEIKEHYWELCNYTHLKGKKYSNRFLCSRYTNTVAFNENTLENYFKDFNKTIKLILTVYALKYPISMLNVPLDQKFGIDRPCGHFLDPAQSESWKLIIGDISSEVTNLARTDVVAQRKLKDILELPDITEEKIEDQFFNQHTDSILSQGYIKWSNGVGKYIVNIDIDDDELTKTRKKNLKKRFEDYSKKHRCFDKELTSKEIFEIKKNE